MRIAAATSTRLLSGALSASALLASYAGCTGQSSERRGGGNIPDLGALAAAGANDSEAGAAGAAGSGPPSGDE